MNINDLKLTKNRKEILDRLDLHTPEEILSYYPYRYEEYCLSKYDDWHIGDTVTFLGEVISIPTTFRYGKRTITRFKVLFEDNELAITIFNRPWIRDLDINEKVVIIGKYNGSNNVTALNYYLKDINEVLGINSIYPLKGDITQNNIRKIIELTYERFKDEIIETLPQKLIDKHGLISYQQAIKNIHFPSDKLLLAKSISRLKYEEFLRFYLSLSIINGSSNKIIKKEKNIDDKKIKEFIDSLSYELTSDQKRSCEEIINDLKSSKIMYRILQGDVGSGKTIVGVVALYANYLAGFQGALMAPTEILAKQHYLEIAQILKKNGVKVELLYSDKDDSSIIKERLKSGDIDIIIGTHALFSDDVEMHKLGLVITDEQHRFGVKQRRKLKEKGENVDYLMMSATPIPRTLASSIYGDIDLSTIETMPQGRKGSMTYLIKKNSIVDILTDIKEKLFEGRQAYIIAAAIEENENYNAKDVLNLYESLQEALKPYKLAFLHGKMKDEDKDKVMSSFNNNEVQVLVSTTVVEVGINVKNATVMVIYDADKFGLSQLHQLRGRIQRSNYLGTCYLLTNSKDENALNRLKILTETNDGFKIAYEDLKLRGPGDFLGVRQSGLPSFILGNPIEDKKFVEAASEDAKYIINNLNDVQINDYYDKIMHYINNNHFD